MRKIECPFCKVEFEAEEWERGICPWCGENYDWDEVYDNYDNSYRTVIEWENG